MTVCTRTYCVQCTVQFCSINSTRTRRVPFTVGPDFVLKSLAHSKGLRCVKVKILDFMIFIFMAGGWWSAPFYAPCSTVIS